MRADPNSGSMENTKHGLYTRAIENNKSSKRLCNICIRRTEREIARISRSKEPTITWTFEFPSLIAREGGGRRELIKYQWQPPVSLTRNAKSVQFETRVSKEISASSATSFGPNAIYAANNSAHGVHCMQQTSMINIRPQALKCYRLKVPTFH
jgi:hypothetical protein